jgi:ATP-binding cassette, subfamily B, bacterial MsbA
MSIYPFKDASLSKKPRNDWQIYKRLLGYVKQYWYIFAVAAVASALYSAIDAGMIRLLKPLIDEGFVDKDPAVIRLIPIVLPLIFLARGIASFFSDFTLTWLSRRIVTSVRQELFDHYLKLPARFYDLHSSGELLSKLTFNVEQIAKACTDAILDSVRNGFLAIFLVGVMISVSWKLTAWFFIAAPLIYACFAIASYRFRKFSHRIQKSMAHVTHVAEENLSGYREVRIYGGQAQERASFVSATEQNRKLEMGLELTKSISVPLIQVLGGCGLALTLYVAIESTGTISLSAGAFTTFASAMLALLKPIKELTNVNNKIQRGIAGAQSIFEVLDLPPEPDEGRVEIKRSQGSLELKNISFRYNAEHPYVLRDINLQVDSGQVIALVGGSGGGKTTLVSLLPRLYDHYDGKILIDGQDIREIRLDSLRRQFAMVSQHVTLFNASIAQNIAYGEASIDPERLRAAAEAAHVLEFTEKWDTGLDTLVGDDGVLLSGGQRQRVAIARAIYKDAPILILDEATSALDSVAEAKIQSALEDLMKDRTTLVIAHRLSTIKKADQILVLDQGRIVESGNHQELINRHGVYAQLHNTKLHHEPTKNP